MGFRDDLCPRGWPLCRPLAEVRLRLEAEWHVFSWLVWNQLEILYLHILFMESLTVILCGTF